MSKELNKGVNYFIEGFSLIKRPEFRWFVIIPIIINTFVFIGFVVGMSHYFSQAVDYLLGWLPQWLAFLEWLLWLVFVLLVLLVIVYAFVFVSTLIASPFYGVLAERVQIHVCGQPPKEGSVVKELILMIPRSVSREFLKLAYYIPRALLLFIISFIPLVNAASPVLWTLLTAWMMTLEFTDYAADNNKVGFPDLKRFLQQNRLTSLGFGGSVWLATLVPLLNLVAMPAAVAGGTKWWVENNRSRIK